MAADRDSLQFERHEVGGLLSVAHLFPRSAGRTGIYVLTFAGDDCYVGQSLDVVGRFAEHRRRWQDIIAVDFYRVPARKLDELERRVIGARQDGGAVLRNVTYARGDPTAASDLDWTIEVHDQYAWLNHGEWLTDTDERVEDISQRMKKRSAYERLDRREDFNLVTDVLRSYVQMTVPRPRATELTFWALSAMPQTNREWPRLAAVSINKMETIVLGHLKGHSDELWGFINVSERVLTEPPGALAQLGEWSVVLERRQPNYEAAGGDCIGIDFPHPTVMLEALSTPNSPVVSAARELNLRLMRKGPTFQWRGHCFDLADHVVATPDSDGTKV